MRARQRPITVFGLPVIPKVFETKQELLYVLNSNLHDVLAAAVAMNVAAALLN